MSRIAVIVAGGIVAAAAGLGGAIAVALKPSAPRTQQAAPKPMQVVGIAPGSMVYVGPSRIPDGPGVPPALAGVRWVGAGGDLCWGGKNGNSAIAVVPGQTIFLDMLPGSQIAYIYDPAPNVVYFTVCKYG